MVVSSWATVFSSYEVYPRSGKPIVTIILVWWITSILVIITFRVIIIGVSLTINVGVWVILVSITLVTVIRSIVILVSVLLIFHYFIGFYPVSYTHLDVYKRQ